MGHLWALFVLSSVIVLHAHPSYASTWNYQDTDAWKQEFIKCNGSYQSPIDIPSGGLTAREGPFLSYHYTPWENTVIENGHNTLQVNCPDTNPSHVRYFGKRYNLIQFHFHFKSEHLEDGVAATMEVHFVHQAADGALLAIGILMDEDSGADQPWLAPFWEAGPTAAHSNVTTTIRIDPSGYLPDDRSFVYYDGSTTTPECLPAQFVVLRRHQRVSSAQVQYFVNTLLHSVLIGPRYENTRPVNSLCNRRIYLSNGASAEVGSGGGGDDDDDDSNLSNTSVALLVVCVSITLGAFGVLIGFFLGKKKSSGSEHRGSLFDYQLQQD